MVSFAVDPQRHREVPRIDGQPRALGEELLGGVSATPYEAVGSPAASQWSISAVTPWKVPMHPWWVRSSGIYSS
jgi:hypothetical protein